MRVEEWLYMDTTYGPSHDQYVSDLYWDLYNALVRSFTLKNDLDDHQRFSRLANILFKHSEVFAPYR